MKPIDLSKLPSTQLNPNATFARKEHSEHLSAAVALVARYYHTRGFVDWRNLESWALSTRMGPTLGGAHPGRLRIGIDELCKSVEEVAAADEHVKANGKRLDKELPATITTLDDEIGKLESAIKELEQAAAVKRSELTVAEAEAQHLADARKLVADVEAEDEHSRRRGLWMAVKTGTHGYE